MFYETQQSFPSFAFYCSWRFFSSSFRFLIFPPELLGLLTCISKYICCQHTLSQTWLYVVDPSLLADLAQSIKNLYCILLTLSQRQWFANLSIVQNHLEDWLIKARTVGPNPTGPDSAGLEQGPRIFPFDKFLGVAVLKTMLWESQLWDNHACGSWRG